MVDWFLNFGVEIWQKENILKNSICKEYENSYNSERISKTVIPLDENDLYEFLSNQTSKTFGNKSSDSENFDSKSDDSFEKIYLSEFNETEEIEFSDESCIICIGPLFSETSITLCDCNHNFCSECIRKILYKQIRLEITPLHCPICQTNISIKFLPIIFPLPLISFYIHFQYKKEMKKRGIKTSNCVKCKEIVNIDSVSDYNIVNCQKCNVFWCILCNESPHFPLTCKENFEWKLKFDGESGIIEKTEMIDEKKYIPQKFLKMAKRARDIRFDDQKIYNISRLWRKKMVGNPDKGSFIKSRKTLLFFIEHGFGWLYINNNSEQDHCNKIKTILSESLVELQSLDEAIVNLEKKNFEMRIQKAKQNADIILNEFCKQTSLNR
uniref:RING-type domain-containing protein n=1 Tax=Strongyloides venezuelensis TaxID=75913 RepID=A0A0K0FCN2_STRVS